MNEDRIFNRIDKLSIEKTGRDLLREVFYLTAIKNFAIKQTVPSVLICTSEKGSAYEFGQVYAEILNENKVFYRESHNTYMELEYCPEMNEEDRRRFFQSIRNAALTSNRFYGVLLIDICSWQENEISSSKLFLQLLDYLKENEENIRTIFVSRLGNISGEKVIQTIKKYVNINQLNLGYPMIEEIIDYAKEYLNENDLKLSKNALEELENYIQKLQIHRRYERDDLTRILRQIVFDCKKEKNNLENVLVTGDYLERMLPEIKPQNKNNRIGFHI